MYNMNNMTTMLVSTILYHMLYFSLGLDELDSYRDLSFGERERDCVG